MAALVLGGCPDPTSTAIPLDSPETGSPVVSVCYPPLVTDHEAETMPVAQEACEAAGAPDADLRYWKRSLVLNDCPLFKKARITFFCDRPKGVPLTGTQDE